MVKIISKKYTHAHAHTPLLTQQFKLRCQAPKWWKRERPGATAPPFPLKSSIPTTSVSLGYITAGLAFLFPSQKLSLDLEARTAGRARTFLFLLPSSRLTFALAPRSPSLYT